MKEERSPWGTKGRGGEGASEMGKGLLELYRRWSQRTSSGISGAIAFIFLEESSLPSTVDRQVVAVDCCDGRPSKVEAIHRRGPKIHESLCLQLSTTISVGGRPTEADGRPLGGQRSTASRQLQAITPNVPDDSKK